MAKDDRKVLNRRQLYESVWMTPMTRLSRELGLSDVGLAKICRRMEIPRPPRGYWRQLEVGRAPPKPELKPISKAGIEEVVIDPRPASYTPKPKVEESERVPVPDTLIDPHPLTIKTQTALEKGKEGEKGIISPRNKICLHIRVSRTQIDRSCLIMDTLVKAIAHRGYKVQIDKNNGCQTLVKVDGENFYIGIDEKTLRTDHIPTRPEIEQERLRYIYPPRYDYHLTGKLMLSIYNARNGVRSRWQDGKIQKIEDCLGEFVRGLELAAQREKEWRVQCEQWRIEREEQERRAQERRRQEYIEKQRIEKLMSDVSAWAEARQIRAYIAELEAVDGDIDGISDWIKWAKGYVNKIDPLSFPEKLVFNQDIYAYW